MIDFKNIHYDSNHIWGNSCVVERSSVWFDFRYNRRTAELDYCSTSLSSVEKFVLLKGCGALGFLIEDGKLKNGTKEKRIVWG